MKQKKEIRKQFKEAVFTRDNYKCIICGKDAVDAHHILDRGLWLDGGYHLDNGASLCEEHHLQAESCELSCDEIRAAAGIKTVLIPPYYDSSKEYDKWGQRIK